MKILVLSDIHGNWPALQAVLHAEQNPDHILCLGDLVGYGPQPAECVAWAMRLSLPSHVIQGNHDRAFGLGIASRCAPTCQHLATTMQSATSHLLTSEMKHFLAKLQPLQELHWGNGAWIACHTITARPLDTHPRERSDRAWRNSEIARLDSDIILIGHPDMLFVLVGHPGFLFLADLHVPLKTELYGTVVVNPGSVGQPWDGDPSAAYAVWEDGEVTLRRAAYDVEQTIRSYNGLGLESRTLYSLTEVLRTGKTASPAFSPQTGESVP